MYATQALTHLVPLAEELDKNKVTPGVLGFIVFAALAVGVWLLMKSMNRHMGKVDFEEAPDPAAAEGVAERVESGAPSGSAGSAGSAKRK
ncbi:hypothetical protein OG345_14550 [Streptomyces sp. NBC_01220]|uniref:hypothetical protein n=1 Tax=unclassified Streptomyces TaxID=2593676 RepID=UPI002E2A4C1F|nr:MULTISPECIES: hypothetical protein [unclassified Streptomyces]WSQ44134.1 hypothetical protein OG345_14550 [Streptomyces sp. NBC_01220]